ncbi:MAG: glycosyltransferase family 4 protein [Kastovskya adunca ATA6-11-RM4]|jgi:glycosyltransferase involved in cell wall biosynthesis|nr:glycosyltransferase family 4 protein [Kastovskya adunca ATA6-11-RM4]
MNTRKYRLLIVASHPVQYAVPLFRLMASHQKLDILVAYCSLQGAEPEVDAGFGIEVAWDIPLLDGYPWIQLSNQSPKPRLGKFFGLINSKLWNLVRSGDFDAVVAFTGYAYASFWIVAAAAKTTKTPLLFGTDAHELSPRDRQLWKASLKKLLLPQIFRLADTTIVPSSGSVRFMHSLGIPEQLVQLTPYVVNNEWWIHQAKQVNRASVREQWEIPQEAPVVLFCAKFQPWKRPQDVLQAFAKANASDSYLVMAGEGPLRRELEAEAKALNLSERVRFLGFVNQSQLPSVYCSADLFVFPSEYEPFGVVVNEAMLCGCPVVASDRVGAGYDLIRHGETGLIYACGDVDALAAVLQDVLPHRERLKQMGEAAYKRMETWSPRENVEALVEAIEKVVASRRGDR